MPRVEREDASLYYETEGSGETVAFVGEMGYGAWQWGWQHRAVAGPHESLVWDLRGTGRSDVPPGPYAVETLAADLEAVLADAGADRAHLVGLGLGGLVALRYALDCDRARSLTLVGTSAGGEFVPGDPVERLYAPKDDEAALRATLAPVLTEAFREDQPDVVEGIVRWRAGEADGERTGDREQPAGDREQPAGDREQPTGDAPEAGWRAQAAAIEGCDLHDRLHEVTVPALVVHGTADALWPFAGSERLAAGLPRGRHVAVEGGPHLVTVERSRVVDDYLLEFLDEQRSG